jgi:hypothetical protein
MRTVNDMSGTVHSATILGMGIVLADTARRGHHDLARTIAAQLHLDCADFASIVHEADMEVLRSVLSE